MSADLDPASRARRLLDEYAVNSGSERSSLSGRPPSPSPHAQVFRRNTSSSLTVRTALAANVQHEAAKRIQVRQWGEQGLKGEAKGAHARCASAGRLA